MRATFNLGSIFEETDLTTTQVGELIERALGRMVNPNTGKPIKLRDLALRIEVDAASTSAQEIEGLA